jgi:hypothetical protein
MVYQVDYYLSLYPSKFLGYQAKAQNTGKVTLYISTIWNQMQDSTPFEYSLDEFFYVFVDNLIYTLILERVCIERAFQKIRMKDRCNPCKMEKYALIMTDFDRLN